jgi:hypothetical protein
VRAARVAGLGGLLVVITVAWVLVANPASGVAFYALIPIVLSGLWFGRRGAVLTAVTAVAVYLATELLWRPEELRGAQLWGLWKP